MQKMQPRPDTRLGEVQQLHSLVAAAGYRNCTQKKSPPDALRRAGIVGIAQPDVTLS